MRSASARWWATSASSRRPCEWPRARSDRACRRGGRRWAWPRGSPLRGPAARSPARRGRPAPPHRTTLRASARRRDAAARARTRGSRARAAALPRRRRDRRSWSLRSRADRAPPRASCRLRRSPARVPARYARAPLGRPRPATRLGRPAISASSRGCAPMRSIAARPSAMDCSPSSKRSSCRHARA